MNLSDLTIMERRMDALLAGADGTAFSRQRLPRKTPSISRTPRKIVQSEKYESPYVIAARRKALSRSSAHLSRKRGFTDRYSTDVPQIIAQTHPNLSPPINRSLTTKNPPREVINTKPALENLDSIAMNEDAAIFENNFIKGDNDLSDCSSIERQSNSRNYDGNAQYDPSVLASLPSSSIVDALKIMSTRLHRKTMALSYALPKKVESHSSNVTLDIDDIHTSSDVDSMPVFSPQPSVNNSKYLSSPSAQSSISSIASTSVMEIHQIPSTCRSTQTSTVRDDGHLLVSSLYRPALKSHKPQIQKYSNKTDRCTSPVDEGEVRRALGGNEVVDNLNHVTNKSPVAPVIISPPIEEAKNIESVPVDAFLRVLDHLLVPTSRQSLPVDLHEMRQRKVLNNDIDWISNRLNEIDESAMEIKSRNDLLPIFSHFVPKSKLTDKFRFPVEEVILDGCAELETARFKSSLKMLRNVRDIEVKRLGYKDMSQFLNQMTDIVVDKLVEEVAMEIDEMLIKIAQDQVLNA